MRLFSRSHNRANHFFIAVVEVSLHRAVLYYDALFVPTAVMLYVLCGGSKCVHGVGFRVLEADRNSPVILNNSKREAKKVLNTENSLIKPEI